jgi:hemerythrin
MKLLAWTAEYSVQIAELDADHQYWFDMINQLHQAMLEGRGTEALSALSHTLMQHTLEHFAHEEHLMSSLGYPGHQAHIYEHHQLRFKADEFMRRFEAGETTITIEMMQFLIEAVPLHITTFDREFLHYLNTNGGVTVPG